MLEIGSEKDDLRMNKIKKYNIEGATLTIPLRYDEKSGIYGGVSRLRKRSRIYAGG